jgi:arylsulfatase A
LRGGKHDIWEGGFREPFLVRWPGKVTAGTTSDDIISMTDVLATFAGILKTKIPAGNAEDSFDVSASFFGNGKPARDSIVLQDASANYAIRQGDWKLIERENAPEIPARNKKVAAAQARKGTELHDELYNLAEDPSESKDVAAKHPNIVKRLRKQLARTREQGFSQK